MTEKYEYCSTVARNQAYYETTAFFLHYNCISSSCTNDRDSYSYRLIFFHGRSIVWKTLLFSLPSLLDFLTFAVLILGTGDCNVDIFE